jgi:hypothetical protein
MTMLAYRNKAALAASTLILAGLAVPAAAQTGTNGTSGGVTGQDVSASTCGSGTSDGTSIAVSGCADAQAQNGGTVDTSTRARTNSRVGMQNSTAVARDEDERARSRTHTMVRPNGVVRSRTMSIYKQRGEKPVREVETTGTAPKRR